MNNVNLQEIEKKVVELIRIYLSVKDYRVYTTEEIEKLRS